MATNYTVDIFVEFVEMEMKEIRVVKYRCDSSHNVKYIIYIFDMLWCFY